MSAQHRAMFGCYTMFLSLSLSLPPALSMFRKKGKEVSGLACVHLLELPDTLC